MKYKVISIVIMLMLLFSFSVCAINFTPEETYNSVVVVRTEKRTGSGFAVKENALITNAHVVGYNKKVTVDLYNGTSIEGTVIKTDSEKDLALIEIGESISPLDMVSEDLRVGQEVYAIGAPRDMPYTMTKGIISALERELGQNTYIQIDASVNSGNSGGPLVDDDGYVIGIITLKASDAEGIGFAISSKQINEFVEAAENTDPENSSEFQNSDAPSSESSKENSEMQEELMKENDMLKIAVCISALLNIVLGLLYVHLFLKRRSKSDPFDFEIEIEE